MRFAWLSGHPVLGSLWETVVLANLRGHFPDAEISYYRTAGGAEIDFVVKLDNQTTAIECKASYSPSLSKGNYIAIEDIKLMHTFVVTPAADRWAMKKEIDVVSLRELINKMGGFF